MLIGRLSALTGVTRRALRHYESIGLISTPDRKGNYRIYSENDVIIIKMIRQAQSVGFSLTELKELVSKKREDDTFPIDIASQLIDNKSVELKKEIEYLQLKKERLNKLRTDLIQTFP